MYCAILFLHGREFVLLQVLASLVFDMVQRYVNGGGCYILMNVFKSISEVLIMRIPGAAGPRGGYKYLHEVTGILITRIYWRGRSKGMTLLLKP